MKIVKIDSILVSDAWPDKIALEDDIDTGVSDGSGNLTVMAGAAKKVGKDTIFYNVEIHAENPTGTPWRGKGYADWADDSLKAEATAMLRKDYCC